MTAVVIPYAYEKSIFRCIVSKVPGQNLAGDAKIRYINHERWLQNKLCDKKIQLEKQRIAEEDEKLRKMQLAEEMKRKEIANKQKVEQWLKEKTKTDLGNKKKETVMAKVSQEQLKKSEINIADKLITEWAKVKAQQKKIELKEKEEQKKIEEIKKNTRSALAGLCYDQWRENARQRQVELPRNGYQIFGPKPQPVVRDEWVTYQPPKLSSSYSGLNNPKLFTLHSFRSERLISGGDSTRSCISKLDLSGSETSLSPWEQRTGGIHARGMPKKTNRRPAMSWSDRTMVRAQAETGVKKERKKVIPFRP